MPVLTDPFGWFTLEFPEGWELQTEDCVTTLRHPQGVGIAYVSGGRHAGGRQHDFGGADFLARFLRSLGIPDEASIESWEGCGCRIYYYSHVSDGSLWRYWSVTDDETALLISYTCDSLEARLEMEQVNGMVRSVRLYHSVPVH